MILVYLIVGLVVGMMFVGLMGYCYFLLTTVKALTEQLKALISTISPIFSNHDLERTLRAFPLLAEQGQLLGRGMESLDATIKMFYKFTFTGKNPVAAPELDDSFIAGYNEEEQAARENTTKLRKAGIETDEGKTYPPQEENPPAVF